MQACRRAASAGPPLRRRSQTPRGHSPDAETAFASFHERNQQWQRDREARLEKRHDMMGHNKTSSVVLPPQRERSSQPRSASAGGTPPHSPRELGKYCQSIQQASLDPELPSSAVLVPASAEPGIGTQLQACESGTLRQSSAAAGSRSPCRMPQISRGKPVRATVPASILVATESQCKTLVGRREQNDSESSICHVGSSKSCSGVWKGSEAGHESLLSSDGERSEVMNQLQALRQCLVSSKARHQDAAGWQKALRVEAARLRGAGAAPLRSSHQRSSSMSSGPAASLQEMSSIQAAAAQARARPSSPCSEAREKHSQSCDPGRSRQRNRSCDSGRRDSQSPARTVATSVRARSRGSSPRGLHNTARSLAPVVSVTV